jgi:serine/threonine protein kinase
MLMSSTVNALRLRIETKVILIFVLHTTMQSNETLSVYLEYVSGGSIHKLLQEYGPFGEAVLRSYTAQILSGLAYLHGRNTVHRYLAVIYIINTSATVVFPLSCNCISLLLIHDCLPFLTGISKGQTYSSILMVISNLPTLVWRSIYQRIHLSDHSKGALTGWHQR